MKLAVTLTDASAVIHAGGDVERLTMVMDIPDYSLPEILRRELQRREDAKKGKCPASTCGISFSLFIDET